MDHEVFVPVTAEALRRTLRDPARVARCVPAFQRDAESEPGAITGRMKVRAGGHTITYRGTLGVTEEDDGVFTVRAEGAEVRGTGSVSVTLDVRLAPAVSVSAVRPATSGEPAHAGTTRSGTDVGFTGVSHAEGRLAQLPREAATQAARRLLERFAARLGEESGPGTEDQGRDARKAPGPQPDPEASAAPGAPSSEAPLSGDTVAGDGDFRVPDGFEGLDDADALGGLDGRDDTEATEDVGAAGSDAFGDDDDLSGLEDLDELDDPDSVADMGPAGTSAGDDDGPPAEAAHARRTMIGRSAEEVDHAPPRGRYAPVPLPEASTATGSLRWVAPAAALALASAVVVTRVLRRRR